MGNILQKAIVAGLFSLEVDSTQDINLKDQICICVRFVNVNSKSFVKERLNNGNSLATVEGQYKTIKKELSESMKIDLNFVIF